MMYPYLEDETNSQSIHLDHRGKLWLREGSTINRLL
ncbi:hypothetical protein J2S10_000176 [Neobacillus ginsengisoli]|uniref:Uncharacterized protein n=1 Tax=Neobacillus ginsengisoli TaxID=904295 RepID=A0ABT9XNY4_9BACI|nr:hypothetical protein [Neobacillus ginsengisoli]